MRLDLIYLGKLKENVQLRWLKRFLILIHMGDRDSILNILKL